MGCLDGLLRWKSIYPGKMLYQEYGITGAGILSKLMSTLTNKKSFIYDFSILLILFHLHLPKRLIIFLFDLLPSFYYELFLVWRRQRKFYFLVKNVCFIAYYLFSLIIWLSYYLVITPLSYTLTLIEQSSLFSYFSQMF